MRITTGRAVAGAMLLLHGAVASSSISARAAGLQHGPVLPSRHLVFGGDVAYPPFEYLDADGCPTGFTVELTRAIADALGLDIEIRLGQRSTVVRQLERGEIDAVAGMFHTPDRDRMFDFSSPYLVSHYVGAVRKDSGKAPLTLQELVGKRVVVEAGDVVQEFLRARALDAEILVVSTQGDALRSVIAGNADCALVVRGSALRIIEESGLDSVELGKRTLYAGEYCYAVTNGNHELLALLTAGLQAVDANGEYGRLREKWLGVYDAAPPDIRLITKYVALIAGPLLILVLLGLAWTRLLRREVARRTEQLISSEQRFCSLVEGAPDAILITSGGRFVYANAAAQRLFGADRPESLIGLPLADRVPPSARDGMRRVIQTLEVDKQAVPSFEAHCLHLDGREVPVEITAVPTSYQGQDGAVVFIRNVERRKRAEAAREYQNILLRDMGRIARIGAWEFDPRTGRVSWTEEVARIHDMDPADETNVDKGLSFYHGVYRERIESAIREAVEHGKPYDIELQMVSAAGRRKWVRAIGQPRLGPDGAVVQLRGSFQDITTGKLAEARIGHLNSILRAIRDVNQLIVREKDAQTLIREGCNILTAARGFEATWITLVRPIDGELVAAQSGVSADLFARIVAQCRSGDYPPCWARVNAHRGALTITDRPMSCGDCALRDAYPEDGIIAVALRYEDEIWGHFCVAVPGEFAADPEELSLIEEIAGDIAFALHTIAAESEHRRAEAQVASLARFPAENPNPVMRFSGDGDILYANNAAGVLLGHVCAEGEGGRLSPAWREHVRHTLDEGDSRNIEIVVDRRTFVASLAPLSEHGYVNVYAHEITEERRLMMQLMQSQKMESVGRLAGGVAHDFNNLLMGIMNYVELCRDRLEAGNPVREWLDEIMNDAKRSANLTRQLLAFARKQTIVPEVLDLNTTIAGMLKLLRRLIGEDIELIWQPAEALWCVKVDPGQVDQILANLCVNARDAIAGAGTISIETGNAVIDNAYCAEHPEAMAGAYVLLAVSDTGCGMTKDVMVHLFEPFFTTKARGEGTGLGLATLYGIVKQNEGFVNVYSEPGKGTTFRVYLPRFAAGVGVAKAAPEPAVGPSGGHETILLVEDEKSIRVTTRLFLEGVGYTVLDAEKPTDALRLAADHPGTIDMLITDVVMPGMSGRALAIELEEAIPHLKCLYISGYTANVIAHRGILDDHVEFLSKPFTREALCRKVREILDGKESGNDPSPEQPA